MIGGKPGGGAAHRQLDAAAAAVERGDPDRGLPVRGHDHRQQEPHVVEVRCALRAAQRHRHLGHCLEAEHRGNQRLAAIDVVAHPGVGLAGELDIDDELDAGRVLAHVLHEAAHRQRTLQDLERRGVAEATGEKDAHREIGAREQPREPRAADLG